MAEETFTHGNKRQLKVENDSCEMLQEDLPGLAWMEVAARNTGC